jgi:hypothetical protein
MRPCRIRSTHSIFTTSTYIDIHFYSKRTTIEEGLKLGDVEISPKPLVKWLGVFLDSKLTFKQHIEIRISKAKAAFYLIRRLGNI